MGWMTRLLGGSGRSDAQVEAQLVSAVRALPGVTDSDLVLRTDASGGGSLRGHVAVTGPAAFEQALAAVGRVLGRDGGRIAVYAVGRLPDGSVVAPTDVGFRSRPSGAELHERYR
ncbi:hypothetical protein [Nocardioides zeae]|uniref:BON domain-containing protein n=1 Tax=Nocardioides zeae TaxID=1457234 RepID=A0A6P0HN69_9ACTN|nr:hypothetical protein [Nocardioides zeae]NEN79075.1 hypothetical protein [Nocardioides zeae]